MSPKRKKEWGRPLEKRYPPRVDATPEEIVHAIFNTPHDTELEIREYRCLDCDKAVHYPDTLYGDGRCETCHAAVKV
jgi:hypothetical protein